MFLVVGDPNSQNRLFQRTDSKDSVMLLRTFLVRLQRQLVFIHDFANTYIILFGNYIWLLVT